MLFWHMVTISQNSPQISICDINFLLSLWFLLLFVMSFAIQVFKSLSNCGRVLSGPPKSILLSSLPYD